MFLISQAHQPPSERVLYQISVILYRLNLPGTSDLCMRQIKINLRGIITAPILYAMEEFPQLCEVVDRGFDNPADVNLALDYLGKSRGIQRARELAAKHASLTSAAIDSLPKSDDKDALKSRRTLVDLTHKSHYKNKVERGY